MQDINPLTTHPESSAVRTQRKYATISKETLEFNSPYGRPVYQTLTVNNLLNQQIAYKVTTNRPELYTVPISHGRLDAFESTTLVFTLTENVSIEDVLMDHQHAFVLTFLVWPSHTEFSSDALRKLIHETDRLQRSLIHVRLEKNNPIFIPKERPRNPTHENPALLIKFDNDQLDVKMSPLFCMAIMVILVLFLIFWLKKVNIHASFWSPFGPSGSVWIKN